MTQIFVQNLKDSFIGVASTLFMVDVDENSIEVEEKKPPIIGRNVSVNIALIGDTEGNIVMTMSMDAAKKVAAKMMFMDEVDELDMMSESAITECLNMISGNFVANMSAEVNPNTQSMFNLDITSPMSVISERDVVIWLDSKSVTNKITFQLEGMGEIILYIGIKNKE